MVMKQDRKSMIKHKQQANHIWSSLVSGQGFLSVCGGVFVNGWYMKFLCVLFHPN